MSRPRFRSLSVRMVVLFSVLLAAIAGFMLSYFPARMAEQAESSTRLRARALAAMVARTVAAAVEFDDAENAAETLGALDEAPDAAFAVVTGDAGVPLASWHSPSPSMYLPAMVSSIEDHISGDLLVVSAPVIGRAEVGGTEIIGTLHLGFSLERLRNTRDDARLDSALATGVVFCVGLLACVLLASYLTRPIHRLTETARRIARGDLPPHLSSLNRDDEVGQMAQALDVMLERLNVVNHQLIDASRHAGMAQVATGVLHNVGNVLTSVNVDVELLHERAQSSTVARLQRAVELLAAETDVTEPARRSATRQFLAAVAAKLDEERNDALQHLGTLRGHVDHVKRAVMMQNAYARVGGSIELIDLRRLLAEAVAIACPDTERHAITVSCQAPAYDRPPLDHNRVLQILVNLVANARDAVAGAPVRTIEIDARVEGAEVIVTVTDSGSGIAPKHLEKLFHAGFTTKPTGHGFGLHSSAQAARQLGGTLTCASDGPGRGATFTLMVPLAEERT
jgi:signal transduction histidine kinase